MRITLNPTAILVVVCALLLGLLAGATPTAARPMSAAATTIDAYDIATDPPLLDNSIVYPEGLSDTNRQTFSAVSTMNAQTLFQTDLGVDYSSLAGFPASTVGRTQSSNSYVSLAPNGSGIGYNRTTAQVMLLPATGTTVTAAPVAPGTIMLNTGAEHFPFNLQHGGGRPLLRSDNAFVIQTSSGLYRNSGGTSFTRLDTSGARAVAMANRGYIAGADSSGNAVVYYNGAKQIYGVPQGTSIATGVNNLGVTVGYTLYPASGQTPARFVSWIGIYGSAAVTAIPNMGLPVAINDAGIVVGLRYNGGSTTSSASFDGMSYSPLTKTTVTLKSLYDSTDPTQHLIPVAINAHGVIMWYGYLYNSLASGLLMPEYYVNLGWVKSDVTIDGLNFGYVEPFKMQVSSTLNGWQQPLDVTTYTASWYVGTKYTTLHDMASVNTAADPNTKSDPQVNLTGTDWSSAPDSTYYVTTVIKSPAGQILTVDVHPIHVTH